MFNTMLSSFALFADCPSTFTLAAIGGGCLLAYQVLLRKPAPVAARGTLSLESIEAPEGILAPMPMSLAMQNARVPELSSDVVSAMEVGHSASAA